MHGCITMVQPRPWLVECPSHTEMQLVMQECDEWIRGQMAKLAAEAAVDSVVFLGQMVALWKVGDQTVVARFDMGEEASREGVTHCSTVERTR